MKNIIAAIGILFGSLAIGAQPSTATSYPWGDLNCSGAVTSVEISAITYLAAGGDDPWPSCPMPADLNCSGAITSSDISIMLYIAAGGSYSPPVTCTK